MKCPGCGADLPSVARKNPLYAKVSGERPKAAVFDLDGTIFDNFQRFKDARRAGLVDKDGKAVAKGMMSKGKAWQKRNKFLYSKKNLAKDKLIPGAKELISQLSTDGYIIVYLTARPKEYYTEILGQLESNGLPLYRDSTDRVMLITKPGGGPSATKYKGNEIRQLQGEFTVEMLFDDEREVLEEASKYGVPGLYTSVSDHVKTNPGTRDPDAAPYDVPQSGPMGDRVFVDDEEEITVVTPETMQMKLDAFTEAVKSQTNPDTSDYREAAGTIIMEGDKVLLLRRSTKETSRHGMWELPGGKLEEGETAEEAAINEAKEETGLDVVIAKSAGKHVDHNMHKVYHGFIAEPVNVNQEIKLSEEHDESLWVTLEEALAMEEGKLSHHARELFSKMTVMKNPAKRGKDSKGPYYRWGGGKKFYYTAGSKKSREAARKKAYGQAKAAFASGYRKNPANPKKVQKGKKLYKHMNGQEPEKVKVEKVDIGDVWYKVGEGGCWQIGYMSGKETGKEDQKYVHTFNEETQDGDFPELYATMPESGKPMLIIKGGTWKIKTDDKGVAWIYD